MNVASNLAKENVEATVKERGNENIIHINSSTISETNGGKGNC